ncbi:MAG: MGMT family protein [Planctomycetia bacterium]|nr:MGMT family protein [Planctomycetia bacterium]
MANSNYELIYDVVRRIPSGRVATYGQVAELSGLPRQARQVGYALFHLDEKTKLPWHRVVNARGEISFSPARQSADRLQQVLLEAEGIVFNSKGKIDLKQYRWKPAGKRSSK